jgi:hypothetical protein
VAGGDHYDRFKVPSLDQFIGLSGDLAGIEVPGVGRDEGDNFSRDFLFGRAVQKFPDLPREGGGIRRIKGPGHGRSPDFFLHDTTLLASYRPFQKITRMNRAGKNPATAGRSGAIGFGSEGRVPFRD